MKLFFYQDDIEQEVVSKPPFSQVYETKSISFKLVSDSLLIEPHLLIGDMKLELRLKLNSSENYEYETQVGKYFINNVGMALIELVDDSETIFESLGTANVLSSKVTTERLKAMLEYICKTDVRLLHCCFSKTFVDSSGKQFEYTDLHHKLLMTEKALSFLWESRHKFRNQPCKRVKAVDIVKKYQPKDLVDERGYSWLLSHMNELEFTVDASSTLINRYGKGLTARNIATSTIIDDKDIFENQVIFSFLVAVKQFVDSLESEQNYGIDQIEQNSEYVDIVPFIQSFVSDKFNIRAKLVSRINLLVDNCLKFVSSNFTNTYIPNIRPRITQYVSRHNHYMSLYKLMDHWWNINASSMSEFESVHQLLFSIKSMDKLYELFVLLQILDSFKDNGFAITQSEFVDFETFPSLSTQLIKDKKPFESFNFYRLENDNFEAELYLEPIIYPYRESINEGELFILDKGPDERDAKKLFRAKYVRTPDYVLKIRNKTTSEKRIYILDAKYSKFETVLYERMQTKEKGGRKFQHGLVDKYLHGIRVFDKRDTRMVDGIFATYISGRPTNRRKVIQGVSSEFGIWGNMPIAPFMDLVEFAPIDSSEYCESKEFIAKLLDYSARH